jgi:hypothetical protein
MLEPIHIHITWGRAEAGGARKSFSAEVSDAFAPGARIRAKDARSQSRGRERKRGMGGLIGAWAGGGQGWVGETRTLTGPSRPEERRGDFAVK